MKKEEKKIEIVPDLDLWILKGDVYKIINDYIMNADIYKYNNETILTLRQIKRRIANGEVRKYE
jgi:hypothetical protein